MINKLDKAQKIHLVASSLSVIVALVVYIFLAVATNSLPTEEANDFLDLWPPALLGVLLICIAYSVFVVFRTKGWLRLFPVAGIVLNLLLFAVAAFFYTFGKMYSSSRQ